ncbi:MAG: hypothetical protein E7448_03765 [Ruminococcaceae bacterium]|nr:hypothetical protein [Oscillospiraceae bacterium]
MPQKWQQVDTDFPTFTGNESVSEKVDQIINYLRILVEELQYQLQNLDASNWNANAWSDLTASTEAAVTEKVRALENSITALKIQINALAGRVNQEERRVTEAENAISGLEQRADEQAEQTDLLLEQLGNAQADIDDLQQRLDEEGGIEDQLSELNSTAQTAKDLQEQLNGDGGVMERLDAVEDAADVISRDAEGNPVIGLKEGVLNLVGKIYINGILFEGGVSDETTES